VWHPAECDTGPSLKIEQELTLLSEMDRRPAPKGKARRGRRETRIEGGERPRFCTLVKALNAAMGTQRKIPDAMVV